MAKAITDGIATRSKQPEANQPPISDGFCVGSAPSTSQFPPENGTLATATSSPVLRQPLSPGTSSESIPSSWRPDLAVRAGDRLILLILALQRRRIVWVQSREVDRRRRMVADTFGRRASSIGTSS